MHLNAQPFGKSLRRGGNSLRAARQFRRLPHWTRDGRCRRFRTRCWDGAPARDDDARQPIKQVLAAGDAAIEIGGETVGAAQPLAESGFAFLHRQFQAGDRAFGDLGGGDKFGNRCPQRLLVSLQDLEAAVERDAIDNCQRE